MTTPVQWKGAPLWTKRLKESGKLEVLLAKRKGGRLVTVSLNGQMRGLLEGDFLHPKTWIITSLEKYSEVTGLDPSDYLARPKQRELIII